MPQKSAPEPARAAGSADSRAARTPRLLRERVNMECVPGIHSLRREARLHIPSGILRGPFSAMAAPPQELVPPTGTDQTSNEKYN